MIRSTPRHRLSSRAARAAPLLALLLACTHAPARAVAFAEFGTLCANGDTSGTFIELTGSDNESTRILIGLRAFDRAGAVIFDMNDLWGARGREVYSFRSDRRFLLVTPAGAERIARPEYGFIIHDNVIPRALDPVAGSLLIYRVTSGRETVLDRLNYGPGGVPAPPPGASMEKIQGAWRFQPSTQYNFFFGPNMSLADACVGYPRVFVTELALACEDGETRGQYLELRTTGPNTILDSRLRLRIYDHTGAQTAELTDPFGAFRDRAVPSGTTWLLGAPGFAPAGPDIADGRLPVELDRAGGRVELSGTFYGTNWVMDSFTYGTAGVPSPPDGFAWSRPFGASGSVQLPAPVNVFGRLVRAPECAAGTSLPHLVVNELALQCMDGRTEGQFVELGVRGAALLLDAPFHLRAFRRDGSQAFEARDVFRALPVMWLGRNNTVLFVQAGYPSAGLADAVLPDTLDPLAGRIEVVREGAAGDSVVTTLEWGDPPLARPPAGSSLDASRATPTLVAYPTPRSLAGRSLPAPGCLARDIPVALRVDELGFECLGGSRTGAFVELGGLTPELVHDPSLGLRLLTANGVELARVFPLFPVRDAWPLGGGESWLVGAPGFAAIAGLVPDVTWSAIPAETPAQVELFRRHPLTGADSQAGAQAVQPALLAPGRTAVRTPDGLYERSALASPRRFDGASVSAGGCWPLPRPEAARLHAFMLACRDGAPAGQYIVLEALSFEALYSPDLVLRTRDRDGQLLGEIRAPFPAAYAGRVWPMERTLLVGAPGFAALTGQAPDAILPAPLDAAAGRIELLLEPVAGAGLVLDAIDYGTASTPAPSPGASLERGDEGWFLNALPAPSGITARLAPPTACLGRCPARTVRFGFGQSQAIAGLRSTLSEIGGEFDYDTEAGAFELESSFREMTVTWTDHFRVEGVPPGTPLAISAQVRTILASADTCIGSRCYASLASVVLASAAGSDSSAAVLDPRRVLTLPVTAGGDGGFDLDLRLRANAVSNPAMTASVRARLEFAGLPAGARVVSCHGFDSRAQRGLGTPVVLAAARQVSVSWPVQGPPGFSARVERSEGDGTWRVIAASLAEEDGMLRLVDWRVEPARHYEYRATWSDEFGDYASPVAAADTPVKPGFSFDGVRPNPSTGAFAAALELPEAGRVRLDVLDVSGRLVASQDRVLEAGRHTVPLARDGALPPGIYVVRMTWRGLVARTSVVVLR